MIRWRCSALSNRNVPAFLIRLQREPMARARKSSATHIPELDHRANSELARRAQRVTFIYVPLSIIVSLVTDLHQNYPRETYGFIGLFLLMGLIRARLTRNFETNHDSSPTLWMRKFSLYTLIPAVALGSIAPLVFFSQGPGWDFIICILSLTGVSAGATSSLSARKNIFHAFQALLLIPTVIVLVFFGEGKTQGLTLLLVLWLGQIVILGHYFHKEFWSGLNAQYQLKLRATALENANTKVEQANRTKGDFLANMSHEIRTPLNGIIGMTDLVLESDLNEQQKDYLNDVKSSGETLLTIINEILDFSKIEAGAIELESIPFSVDQMLQKVVRPLRYSAENRADELIVELDPELPQNLMGDPHRIWQILTNLAGNAVKFTENGKITIGAEHLGNTNGRCTLMLRVSDTGIGIPEEAQSTIFKEFSQADGSTTRKFGGTGLGLAISQKLVTLMDGEITLSSTEGQGSTFAILLHLDIAADEATPAKKLQAKSSSHNLSGLRVLLAEDNTVNAKLASRLLEKSGVVVEWAHDGKEAVEA